jgi:hypothetical protein
MLVCCNKLYYVKGCETVWPAPSDNACVVYVCNGNLAVQVINCLASTIFERAYHLIGVEFS